ncbi:hypothetical protein AK812_SmicGene1488 [Symbiodinium microadriaticum]|uniref:Uncharacterized protein n=1 Tax=Symbiodinium microadriaticum TaxID=2951 RepID=A0A1Q9F3X8_SYMMI|nr:hypothetical protein AK812_SmicGene1488 [Symbiodinium microadriaticum]
MPRSTTGTMCDKKLRVMSVMMKKKKMIIIIITTMVMIGMAASDADYHTTIATTPFCECAGRRRRRGDDGLRQQRPESHGNGNVDVDVAASVADTTSSPAVAPARSKSGAEPSRIAVPFDDHPPEDHAPSPLDPKRWLGFSFELRELIHVKGNYRLDVAGAVDHRGNGWRGGTAYLYALAAEKGESISGE